jgi:PTH1 family peptidyl-tRNA hydrolase
MLQRIINFIHNIFSSKKGKNKENVEVLKKILIVGLGNPGAEYKYTRHNIGFLAADHLAEKLNTSFKSERYGDVAIANYRGKRFIILKPATYMNLSGKAVRYWLEKEKIDKNNLLIITDDVNLDFGTIRIRPKGSDGGHNGLKSIQELIGGAQYPRLRFGIGKDYPQGRQVDYVLGKWTEEQIRQIPDLLNTVTDAVINFAQEGLQRTMNKFNSKKQNENKENKTGKNKEN